MSIVKNQKKKELTLAQYLETPEYEVLRQNLSNSINHNSVMFNTVLKNKGQEVKVATNLIDTSKRNVLYKKEKAEIQLIKEIKQQLNSKAFNTVAKMKTQRDALVATIVAHSDNMPNWNLKVIIK